MKTISKITVAALMLAMNSAWAADPLAEQIKKLRAQREKVIADALKKANTDYGTGLDRLKSLYASKPETAAIIAKEKEELAKVSLVTLPPVIRITSDFIKPEATPARNAPSIRDPEDLARYLIGTKWNYYTNDKFLGDPKIMEFTGPDTATIDAKPVTWKVLSKGRIWVEKDMEFSFNKGFDEFTGGWVPNPNDRKSARLIP